MMEEELTPYLMPSDRAVISNTQKERKAVSAMTVDDALLALPADQAIDTPSCSRKRSRHAGQRFDRSLPQDRRKQGAVWAPSPASCKIDAFGSAGS